jgi:hypothetical protein
MSKFYLAVVCMLALMGGGAAGLLWHYADGSAPDVRGVSEKSPAQFVQVVTATDAVASRPDGGTRVESNQLSVSGDEPSLQIDSTVAEADAADREPEDGREFLVGAPPRRSVQEASLGSAAGRRAGRASRVSSGGHARASVRRTDRGGRSLMGHTVNGVKKSGGAIGKAFGKIGSVFHD